MQDDPRAPVAYPDPVLPVNVFRVIAGMMSPTTSYLGRTVHFEFFSSYRQRSIDRSQALITEAYQIFSQQVLFSVSRLISRAYQEWQNPPEGDNFQDPAYLQYDGPEANRPFPNPSCSIAPGVLTLLLPDEIPNVVQPGHALVLSRRLVQGLPAPDPAYNLRDSNLLRVHLSNGPESRLFITIEPPMPQEGRNNGRVVIAMIGSPRLAYRAFCGAVLYLLFSNNSALTPLPDMLLQSQVRLELRHPSLMGLAPGPLLVLTPPTREALAQLLVCLRARIPSSTLRMGLGIRENPLWVCGLQWLLFEDFQYEFQ
jgi:hypothetical protein